MLWFLVVTRHFNSWGNSEIMSHHVTPLGTSTPRFILSFDARTLPPWLPPALENNTGRKAPESLCEALSRHRAVSMKRVCNLCTLLPDWSWTSWTLLIFLCFVGPFKDHPQKDSTQPRDVFLTQPVLGVRIFEFVFPNKPLAFLKANPSSAPEECVGFGRYLQLRGCYEGRRSRSPSVRWLSISPSGLASARRDIAFWSRWEASGLRLLVLLKMCDCTILLYTGDDSSCCSAHDMSMCVCVYASIVVPYWICVVLCIFYIWWLSMVEQRPVFGTNHRTLVSLTNGTSQSMWAWWRVSKGRNADVDAPVRLVALLHWWLPSILGQSHELQLVARTIAASSCQNNE